MSDGTDRLVGAYVRLRAAERALAAVDISELPVPIAFLVQQGHDGTLAAMKECRRRMPPEGWTGPTN